MKLSLALYFLLLAASREGHSAICDASQCEESVSELKTGLLRSQSMKESACYMGIKSREISDSALTSSSDWDGNHAARLGRLDNQVSGNLQGAWSAEQNVVGEWIMVDLGRKEMVSSGVVTQGRPHHYNQWVTSFKVGCGETAGNIETIREHGSEKVFTANRDMESKVVNMFPKMLSCRYIRIYPQTFHNHMSMRLEIISGFCHDIM